MLALLFVPGFIFGALVANYLFEQYGIYPTPDKRDQCRRCLHAGHHRRLLVVLLVMTDYQRSSAGFRVARHQFRRA